MINKNYNLDISVIVPILNATDSIKLLISSFLRNDIKPKEIILLDSGSNNKITKYFKSISKKNPILIYKKIKFSHPGTARNIGVSLSDSKYLTFFDINTLPTTDWLIDSFNQMKNQNLKILFGKRITIHNSYIKKIIKYCSYGNSPYISLTGTIIEKKFFSEKKLYFVDTRASEDIEWIKRVKKYESKINNKIIIYNGLSGSILFNIKKTFIYSISYSNILQDINNQKKICFFVIIYSTLPLFFMSLNFIYLFFLINSFFYFIFFGFFRPLKSQVKLMELLPFNWILIVLFRIFFDASKVPGLIIGFFRILLRI